MGLDNNDYLDYLAHYGVKGMKWGKHKRIVIDRGDIGTNPYGYTRKGVSLRGKNGTIANFTKTSHKTKGTSYELTWKRRKEGNTYDRSRGAIQNYSDDGEYRTVGIHVNPTTLKKKVSSISSKARTKGQSFINRIAGKRLRKKR